MLHSTEADDCFTPRKVRKVRQAKCGHSRQRRQIVISIIECRKRYGSADSSAVDAEFDSAVLTSFFYYGIDCNVRLRPFIPAIRTMNPPKWA